MAAGLLETPALAQNDAVSRRAAIDGMYPVMLGALEAKSFGRARNICDQAIMWEPQNPTHHYNLACIEAQAGGTRLPYAWGALELAIALGFNDAGHMQVDPDLAPLRGDPRFSDLVRKVIYQATAGAAISSITIPGERTLPESVTPSRAETEKPVAAGFVDGVPVGLYLMNRYISAEPALETSVWYFAPDKTVYRVLERGFSQADLAAHSGPRGKAALVGRNLEIAWADGEKNTSEVERDGSGFTWKMGIFAPIVAFETESEAAGIYQGAEAAKSGGHDLPVTQKLELRADGTFTWEGVSFRDSKTDSVDISLGNAEMTTGRWKVDGFSLVLTKADGAVLRRIAVPQDEAKTVIRPDRMFFGGLMYKRRP